MNQEKIGQFIKDIRKKNNLSQAQLADKLGVTYQAVSKWENGKNLPDISTLQEISKLFSVDIDEIISGEVKEKNNSNKGLGLLVGLFLFAVLIVVMLFVLFVNGNDTYDFQEITTPDSNFSINGSVVKAKDRTSILINSIKYNNEDNVIYKKIECTVYEDKGDSKIKITTCDSNFNMTLSKYFEETKIKIDHQSKNCSMFESSNLYIEILSTDFNDKVITFIIPLEVSDC